MLKVPLEHGLVDLGYLGVVLVPSLKPSALALR
jgi:hypothetical protein